MTREPNEHFNLRMREPWRLWLGLALMALFTLVFIKMGLESFNKGNNGTAFLLACFAFMFGSLAANFLLTLTSKDDAGHLEVGRDGIILDTFFSIGKIPWVNFEGIGIVNVNNQDMLGISLRDPAAYLASRKGMTATKSKQLEQHRVTMRAFYVGATTAFAPLLKPFAFINKIIGKQYFDVSGEEADLMESSKHQNGHHILIAAFWFADVRQVVASVGRWRR